MMARAAANKKYLSLMSGPFLSWAKQQKNLLFPVRHSPVALAALLGRALISIFGVLRTAPLAMAVAHPLHSNPCATVCAPGWRFGAGAG
jgi:hypothetical protein